MYDNPTEEQLQKVSDIKFENMKDQMTLSEADHIVIPYDSKSEPRRLYRFQLDVTYFDGSSEERPSYKTIWNQEPMLIFGLIEGVEGDARPKLSILLDISDCDELFKKLNDLVDSVTGDLPADDIEFLKKIINGTTKSCEMEGTVLDGFEMPAYEDESVLYELTNIDKLVCYLKNQVIKYKTEIAISSGSNTCYKFVNCLIKGYVALNKLYRSAVSSYNMLLASATTLKIKYQNLANDHRRGINALSGIKDSTTEWIRKNLDVNFELGAVKCSNRVELVNNVPITFVEKYSKYVDYKTKRMF
jgi:hypothetical protein